MTLLLVIVAIAMAVGLVAPILTFVALIIGQIVRRRRGPLPRCLACDGPLMPLLDGSHRFLGEAACLRCGRLHEGLGPPATPLERGPKKARETA